MIETTTKIMIKLLNSKIEEEIANHFIENYDPSDEINDYECEFKFDGAEILVPYSIVNGIVTYKNEGVSATRNGVSYSVDDKDHFKISRMDHNPNKRTIQEEIDFIIERAESKDEENRKSSEAIREHNEWMKLNNR